jgi:hypothetical protein
MVLDGTALGDDRRTGVSVLSVLVLRHSVGAQRIGTWPLWPGAGGLEHARLPVQGLAHAPVYGTRRRPARSLFAEAATLDPGLAQQLAVLLLGHALAALLDH